MDLVGAIALAVVLAKVAPAGNPKFTQPVVTQSLQLRSGSVQLGDITDDRQHIDDRLRPNPGMAVLPIW